MIVPETLGAFRLEHYPSSVMQNGRRCVAARTTRVFSCCSRRTPEVSNARRPKATA